MNIYIIMLIAPLGYGLYGMFTGNLPVAKGRKVAGCRARIFGSLLFVTPLVVIGLWFLMQYALPRFGMSENQAQFWTFGVCIGFLPGALAIILFLATRESTPTNFAGSRDEWSAKINAYKPDFSVLEKTEPKETD